MVNGKIFISATIIFASCLIILIGNMSDVSIKNLPAKSESGPVFNKERDKYFWDRLKDPATGYIPDNMRAKELAFVQNRWVEPYLKNTDYFLSNDIWNRRGPYEIGGRTRALALDIRDENIIIAGGISGGMWKSTNNGASWVKTSLPHQLHSVSCLVQDVRPGKENIWYYGTGEYWGNSAGLNGDGIFKSTDNGASWDVLSQTSTSTPQSWDNSFDYCWNIITNPAANDTIDEVLVATASRGIIRSIDGGDTWTTVLGGQSNARFADIAITSDGVYYATLSSDGQSNFKGIFRSEDGVKWVNITPQNFPKNYRRIVIAVSPSDESQVYFLGETPGSGKLTFNSAGDSLWHSLWHYKHTGTNGSVVLGEWDDRSQNLPKPEPTRGQMNSQSGYNLVLKVKPDDSDVVFIGAVAMYRSNSGFKNSDDWAWIGGTCPDDECEYFYRYVNHHADVHEIIFSNTNPNIIYTGSDGGIHKTFDNMSDKVVWISLNNGYFTTQFYSIAIDHGDKLNREIIGGLQDNGTLLSRDSDMENSPWSEVLRADGFCCQIPDGAEYYYASQNSTWQPKIKIFRNIHDQNGKNTISTRIDPIGGADFIWNTPFVLDPNDNNVMYLAGGKMLWRNNNLSEIPFENSVDSTSINWDSLSHTRIDFINTAPLGERISAVNVSVKPANIVLYGTSNGRLFRINNANIGNPQPENITSNNFPSGVVSSIAFDPENADNIIVSFSNYNIISIFHSTDRGTNWTAISGNLEERPNGGGAGPGVNWVHILKVEGKNMCFAGTTAGLFSTAYLNGMATAWQLEGANSIGNMVIHEIDSRPQDNYIVIGTHGTGIYDGFYTKLPSPPEPVILLSPKNTVINVLSTVQLSWNASQVPGFYELEIAKDPNFIEIVHSVNGMADTIFNWLGVEQGHKTYYWRVRNVGAGGVSEFSEVWSFTSAIAPPEIIFPTAGTDQVMTYFTFQWDKVEKATAYHLQVAQGFNITPALIDTIITNNEFEVSNFAKNKRYVWRVASIEDNFEGEFTEIYHFITRHPLSVKNNNDNFGLKLSIYPNPATDKAYISIDSEYNILGEILIFDISGSIIQNIPQQHISSGGMSISINTGNLRTGMYNILFITKDGQYYQKMQIIK